MVQEHDTWTAIRCLLRMRRIRSHAFGLFLDDLAIFCQYTGLFSSKKPGNPVYYRALRICISFIYSAITWFCIGEALNCKVGAWTPWSSCSNDCGVGVMKRKRYIIQIPRNGGKACPPLRQKRGCALYQCKRKSRMLNFRNLKKAFIQETLYERLG